MRQEQILKSGRIDIDALDRSIAADQALTARTDRIMSRLWPWRAGRAPHGFYQPAAFLAGAQERGERRVLWLKVKARLKAKRDGGLPRIQLPANADHCISANMVRAARELEAEYPDES